MGLQRPDSDGRKCWTGCSYQGSHRLLRADGDEAVQERLKTLGLDSADYKSVAQVRSEP